MSFNVYPNFQSRHPPSRFFSSDTIYINPASYSRRPRTIPGRLCGGVCDRLRSQGSISLASGIQHTADAVSKTIPGIFSTYVRNLAPLMIRASDHILDVAVFYARHNIPSQPVVCSQDGYMAALAFA